MYGVDINGLAREEEELSELIDRLNEASTAKGMENWNEGMPKRPSKATPVASTQKST